MIKLLVLLLATGCATVPQSPEPEEPDVPSQPDQGPEPEEPEETPDQTFEREYDACWEVYRQCLKDTPGTRPEADETCFPPHEVCCVTAYRKLKKARGEG